MSKRVFDVDLFSSFEPDTKKGYEKRLHLGNGQYLVFSCKKELAKFSSDTKKYFWNLCTALNEQYARIFELYREAWMVSALARKFNYDSHMREITNNMTVACQWLEKLSRKLRQTNDPAYICMNAMHIVQYLTYSVELVQKVFARCKMHLRAKAMIGVHIKNKIG